MDIKREAAINAKEQEKRAEGVIPRAVRSVLSFSSRAVTLFSRSAMSPFISSSSAPKSAHELKTGHARAARITDPLARFLKNCPIFIM